jgi:5-hydroxyisourate hydrolase
MASSPITCHVLNTLSGTPASNLKAMLTFQSEITPLPGATKSDTISFSAVTDDDGRVKNWNPDMQTSLQDVMDKFNLGDKTAWSIRFGIGEWYEARNVECFWPEIEVKFYVKKGTRHYHVPVLVGPWTYTTYRGS